MHPSSFSGVEVRLRLPRSGVGRPSGTMSRNRVRFCNARIATSNGSLGSAAVGLLPSGIVPGSTRGCLIVLAQILASLVMPAVGWALITFNMMTKNPSRSAMNDAFGSRKLNRFFESTVSDLHLMVDRSFAIERIFATTANVQSIPLSESQDHLNKPPQISFTIQPSVELYTSADGFQVSQTVSVSCGAHRTITIESRMPRA